jgi:hypothetical protein
MITAACTLYFMALRNAGFFRMASELSLFLPTKMYFRECMSEAGGLLVYLGTFCTQFFYYPLLGSLIFLMLQAAVVFGFIRAFRLQHAYYPLGMSVGLMLLLSLTQLDYMLFILKSNGYFFSNGLGIAVAIAVVGGFRRLKPAMQTAMLAFMPFGLYPLLGFYGLFASLICVLTIRKPCFLKRSSIFRIHQTAALGAIVITPYLYFNFVYTHTTLSLSYLSGLPRFNFNKAEMVFWLPFVAIAVCFMAVSLFQRFFSAQDAAKFASRHLLSAGVFMLSLLALFAGSNRDKNFHTEIALNLLALDCQWAKIIQQSEASENPTRLIVMLRILAMQRTDKAGDRMFSFVHASAPQVAHRPSACLRDAGSKTVYYYYGQINHCYRWCMEDMVEYGMKALYLKYMLRCALLNGETDLARKYYGALSQVWFHREWAKKYEPFLDNPALMDTVDEFRRIRPLMAYDDMLLGDNGMLEHYLLNSFANMEGGPPDLVEVSLQCNLIQKNSANFWPRFFLYARTHRNIPVHYQEAALLYAYLDGKVDVSRIQFDRQVRDRFDRLIHCSQQYGTLPHGKQAEILRPLFGDTFWYYYFFVQGLKTS